MKKRKRRKIKLSIVLIILSIIMIIIGGIIIMKKNLFNIDNKNKDLLIEETKKQKEEQQEEIINEEQLDTTTSTLEKAPSNNEIYINLNDGEYITDKGYKVKIENGITTIDGLLIVNKTYSIPSSYGGNLTEEVMKYFNQMKAEATTLGLNIWIQSGYRSYKTQETIYNNYVARDSQINADTYSARPGHSEHQTGLAFDLNSIDDSFTYTDEGKWINENCYRFGFIIRYPKGKENITGYMHESWHLRYVGEELAKALYNDGNWITIEEYFGITSSY